MSQAPTNRGIWRVTSQPARPLAVAAGSPAALRYPGVWQMLEALQNMGAQQFCAFWSQVSPAALHTGAKAGHDPPKVEEGLGLWSWMLPPPLPEPPNVWSESDSVV